MGTKSNKELRIFISPANHPKPYIIKGYNEKQQMEKLAPLLIKELESYEGVTAVLTEVYSADQSYRGRPKEAAEKKCDLYVALHSNAGGGKGACVFYHPASESSKQTALAVVKALNAVCPIKSNRAVQPAVYPWSLEYWNLGELREPMALGIPPVLIEHEFHDTADGAGWIISSLEDIAVADAAGIAAAWGLTEKHDLGDVNGDGAVNTLDAAMILRHSAGMVELTPAQLAAADVNGDGNVDANDAASILRGNIK